MDQAESLRILARNRNSAGKRALIVAIASGKGGTGKTSFCVNLAIALSSLGKKVMIVDADFGLSNVDVMLDAHPKHHIGEVLEGKVSLREAACRGHGGIWYVSGGSGAEELMHISRHMTELLQEQITGLDTDLDYVFLDCGAGISAPMLRLIASTDECLLLLTPEPTSITDAFVLLKGLVAKPNYPPVYFVMNRAETPLEAITMSRYFKNIVRKYLGFETHFLGHVAFDKSMVQSIKKQLPLMLSYPESEAAKDIVRIASQYTNSSELMQKRKSGLRGFFERAFARYGD